MATTISTANVSKSAPKWYNRLKKFVVIGLIPVAVVTIKSFWEGDPSQLDKVLLVLTVTIPGTLEAFGMLLSDEEETPQ